MPHAWHDTLNRHFFNVADFLAYCRWKRIKVERSSYLGDKGRFSALWNLFIENGIIIVSK
ncbi:MAG: methionine biosynthesis protein MetW [Syntrophobacteraceae bacterium]